MKTKAILFALLTGSAIAQIVVPGTRPAPDLVPLQLELSKLRQQVQVMNNRQQVVSTVSVPGESIAQRDTRRAYAVQQAEAAYQEDWKAKNPLKFSGEAPKLPRPYANQAIADSDADAAAAYRTPVARPAPQQPNAAQMAALQRKIKALEAQVKAVQQGAKK